MDDSETLIGREGDDDAARIRSNMASIEEGARTLRWAKERPWRGESHVWTEDGLPVVDLHDLNVRLAREAVRITLGIAADLECGAICFVTGRGRHSIGPPALRGMVASELRTGCAEHPSWSQRAGHAGRWMLITDPNRAPRVATGQLGPAFWTMVILFLCLAFWALVGLPG
jgi:hypothetical protein